MSPFAAGETLSVCCMTRGPTLRVARSLGLFREVADEIVVAVDDRIDPNLLGPIADVADIVVRYPYADPVDRPVEWLHRLCSGSWIMNVDDDEIPSAALLAELPTLVRSTDVTHFFVPRLWPYRGAERYLDEAPWQPDWQLRIVVNDPRVTWFPGILHWPAQAVGPHRFLELPLYHLDLLLNTQAERALKAERYERALPGRRLAGLPMNLAVHVPETRRTLCTLPIPAADAAAIAAVVACEPWPPPRTLDPAPRHATREEIDVCFRGGPMTHGDYAATIAVVGQVRPFRQRERRAIPVRVENGGGVTWPWGGLGSPDVRLSYRWLDRDGRFVADGLHTPMPEPVRSGSGTVVAAAVLAPERAGAFVLELDLVHEHHRWFGCRTPVEVDVKPAPCVAVLADDEAGLVAAARAVVDRLPTVEPVLLTPDPGGATARLGYRAHPSPGQRVLGGATGRGRAGRLGVLARGVALVLEAGWRRADTPRFAGCSAVLLATGATRDPSAGKADAWARTVTMLGARLAGLPVIVASTGHPSLLARLALRMARATVVPVPSAATTAEAPLPAVTELERVLAA